MKKLTKEEILKALQAGVAGARELDLRLKKVCTLGSENLNLILD